MRVHITLDDELVEELDGHVWDPDPTAWVSSERIADPRGAA